ncbi:MAG: hypothetical protein NTV11_00745 [Rhodocyclales bacterium]|nr:hypothetical protein [Rhodocyclales bacterium]
MFQVWAEQKEGSLMNAETDGAEGSARRSLIDISVESWRFARLFARVLGKLDEAEAPRYSNQLRYFVKKLEDGLDSVGLKLVSLEGQLYDAGMAASPLNIADFGPEDRLVVDQMIEPILMGPDGLVKGGTVMLKKVEAK